MIQHLTELELTREVSPSLSTIQSSFSANLFTSIGKTSKQVLFYYNYVTELYIEKEV